MAQAVPKEGLNHGDTHGPHAYDQAVANSLSRSPLGYLVNPHHRTYDGWFLFRESVKKFEPLMEGLEYAFSSSVFCCGGIVLVPDMEKSRLKVKSKESAVWKEFLLGNLPIQELLEYCNPAQFGDLKEMKTVVDTEVRSAYQIETSRFAVLPFPCFEAINKHISEELLPGRKISLDKNKFNIYGKDGFFKQHVDTPSCANMVGTVVVCLPSFHKGGELVVNHDGLQHVFDFSQHSGNANKIQWAAFYSDCVHEVRPVVEGHRVSITYNIRLPDTRSFLDEYHEPRYNKMPDHTDEHFEVSARCPSRPLKKVDMALQGLRDLKDGGTPPRIGFFLKHRYTFTGLQPNLLKGEDKELFDYLSANEWNCSLKSVLTRFQTTTFFNHYFDMDYEATHEVYEFAPYEVMPSFSRPSLPQSLESTLRVSEGVRVRDYRQWRIGIPFIEIYRKPDDTKLVRNNEGRPSWVGNEVYDIDVDKVYLDSAAIVKLGG